MKYNMESKFIWMVLFVLGFIPCKVTAGHGMTISPGRMSWLESFSFCSLASKDSLIYLYNGEYRGWAGGIYLNTQWRIHQGCYSHSGAMQSNDVHNIKRLTPALCSEKCKMILYFALKYNWCVCISSIYNLEDADLSKCTYSCTGSDNDVCGDRTHFTVYKHITGKFKPKNDVDQNLACSVIVPRNDTFVLKAVDCSLKYWTICVIYGVPRQMGFTDTYQAAHTRCSSSNGTILSTIHNLDNLVDGREYWSNIFRSRFLKWTTNESFDEICYEVDGLLNVDCVYLTSKYRDVKYIPLPCKYKYTAICKPKQPGDPAVIRQCQNSKDIILHEINTIPITKGDISTEESNFPSPETSGSSHVRTEVTHFSASTMSSIVVLVIPAVFVLVCLQASLIAILRRHGRKSQEGNQYELTSQLTTVPRIYAQPEIQHYEVVDDNIV